MSSFSSSSLRVLVTGAAGQIAYSLLPRIALGEIVPGRMVDLVLLDLEFTRQTLEGVKLELEDLASPFLGSVTLTSNNEIAFKDVDLVIMTGAFPRKEGMERSDLLTKNCAIFKEQGDCIGRLAKESVLVLVVGNPANTNCMVAVLSALPHGRQKETQFSALTRLDHNRAIGAISIKAGVPVSKIKDVYIWGNHSNTQYPDISNGFVESAEGRKSVRETVNDDKWLDTEFPSMIRSRGAQVMALRKFSSAMSASQAIIDHMRDWISGTKVGVSMGVVADGSYGIEKGVVFSFPVICVGQGKYKIIEGLSIPKESRDALLATNKELRSEMEIANSFLSSSAKM